MRVSICAIYAEKRESSDSGILLGSIAWLIGLPALSDGKETGDLTETVRGFLQNGFFGTLKEARTLRAISIERGIERLVLVCSEYHSRRVWVTFSALLKDLGVEIEVHTADEKVGVWGLLIEYVKLLSYKYVLIPYEMWSLNRDKMALSRAGGGIATIMVESTKNKSEVVVVHKAVGKG